MITRLAFAAMVAAAPAVAGPYMLTLLSYAGMGALVALGLVLLTGVGGLTSFGQAAFVGLGAYATGWLTAAHGLSPWLGLLLALAASGSAAALLGLATLRLEGHLLPVSTIAWGLALFFLFGNLDALGGHTGMSAIPPVTLGPFSLASSAGGYWLIWAALGTALLLCANLLSSRQGRAVAALRGGTALAGSLGIDAFRVRLLVFTIAGLLAGLSGWLLAHVQRFISPTAFDVGQGIEYLFMAMLGGAGHVGGAVLGAALVTLARDTMQDLLPHVVRNAGQVEAIAISVLFILLLQRARTGIVPALLRALPQRRQPPPPDAPPLPRRTLPAPGTPVLEVEQVSKRFGGLLAVNAAGFTLRAGEILALIGPNGAGKSTMIGMIDGSLTPDSGRIRVLGHDIAHRPARRIAALGLARGFQHVRLRPTLSLLDNVLIGLHLRTRAGVLACCLRLDRAEEASARAEAMAQLRRVGLDANPHALAGSLPLGSQRTLELARALAADPVLLLLDEPAAGLAHPEKQALAAILAKLRTEGVTILLVEHDMTFVMALANQLVVMNFGSKLAEGPPATIRTNPAVQSAYLGDSLG